MARYIQDPIDRSIVLQHIERRTLSLRQISQKTGAQQYLVLQVAVQHGYELNTDYDKDGKRTVKWLKTDPANSL